MCLTHTQQQHTAGALTQPRGHGAALSALTHTHTLVSDTLPLTWWGLIILQTGPENSLFLYVVIIRITLITRGTFTLCSVTVELKHQLI